MNLGEIISNEPIVFADIDAHSEPQIPSKHSWGSDQITYSRPYKSSKATEVRDPLSKLAVNLQIVFQEPRMLRQETPLPG